VAVTCSDVFAFCTKLRIVGTLKGSTAAVISETTAVKIFTAAEKT
jgi:hypothetical protein